MSLENVSPSELLVLAVVAVLGFWVLSPWDGQVDVSWGHGVLIRLACLAIFGGGGLFIVAAIGLWVPGGGS